MMFNLNKGRNPKTNTAFVDPIKSKWFNDVNFRRAVAYGINREAIKDNLFRGLAQPQNSPISIASPYFLSPEKGLKVYDYQPEKSKKILLQAGYKYDPQQQLLDAQGNLVRFTLMAPTNRATLGAQVKSDLEKIGMSNCQFNEKMSSLEGCLEVMNLIRKKGENIFFYNLVALDGL